MRIQHNIMAMNAYRNYTNNVSAMKSNLEKLSSGYKINRAGDDAAGLAISEKMRAQITGLETAQKNAKDGISLVQTAEGALTEVHDMLNRMVELASQSANGTYDGTDREQLQKEVNQLLDEINRIADSSNFNGIKLLDGSMSSDAAKITGDARIISDVYTSGKAAELSGTKTFLDGEVKTEEVKTEFEVEFTGLTGNLAASSASSTYTAGADQVDGITVTVDADTATEGDVKVEVEKTNNAKAGGSFTLKKTGDKISIDGTNITFDGITGAAGAADTANAKYSYTIAKNVDGTSWDITVTAKENGAAGNDEIKGISDGTEATLSLTGGTDEGYKVTLTSAAGTAVQNVKTADWKDTVEITGDKGVSAKIDAAKITAAVGEKTVGAVTTTPPDKDLTFNFKIGGTEFKDITIPEANIADATGKATAAEIADAVANAMAKSGTNGAGVTDATVEINGIKYTMNYTDGDSKITFKLADEATDDNIAANYDWDVTGTKGDTFDGNHTAGVKVTTAGTAYKDAPVANTVFKIEASDIKDGTQITIDGTTVTLAVGKNSKYTQAANVITLTHMEEGSIDLNQAISAISKGFAGDTKNFIVGVNDTKNGDTHPGLTVHRKEASTERYTTKAQLAGVFEIQKAAGGGLKLQIGDTADTYNQLNVSISDCHATSLGISGVDISTQDGASDAISAIKNAINKVSDVRGTLGATQNRLDHTINNLSVMTENIQDAESTIRDVDVAEEMMAYTKNNILIQSAQAMLAQANQVPQGVLQLLQ